MVRAKHRYILCDVILEPGKNHSKIDIEEHIVYTTVKEAILLMHGDYGQAVLQRSLNVKYINSDTRTVLIRVKRGVQKMALQALTLVKKIGKWNAFFRTLHVSGTIRSSQKFLVMHQKQEMIKLLHQCSDPKEKKKLQQMIDKCKQSCEERAKAKFKEKPQILLTIDSEDDIDSD